MSAASVALADLQGRIGGGIQPVLSASWNPPPKGFFQSFLGAETLARWQGMAIDLMSPGGPPQVRRVDEETRALAARLAGDREVLLTALHHPKEWLPQVLPLGDHPLDVHAGWAVVCWVVEALWRAGDSPTAAVIETDVQYGRPLAARLRFLVLSEAFRHRGEASGPWLPREESPFEGIFGDGSWHILVGRARQARWTWHGYLDSYASHPPLAAASSTQIEHELDALLFRGGHGGAALCITGVPLDLPAEAGADDLTVHSQIVERHLLPRFRLWQVATLQLSAPLAGLRPRRVLIAVAALLIGLGAAALTVLGALTPAAWAAAGFYAAIVVGAVTDDPGFLAPWMLRWPAAASLGLLVLAGLNKNWWDHATGPGLTWGAPWAPLALVVAGYGYLVLEVRNHGVGGWLALGRSAVVLFAGLWHAFLVSLFGVVAVLPMFTEDGGRLSQVLAHERGHSVTVLAAATGWCLAAGVFSQILWDDRPITAPLAHTTWRSGRDA